MTVYAEVHGDTLIRFPYTEGSLQADNPSTRYPAGFDLAEVFAGTEAAMKKGHTLAPVTYLAQPAYDVRTQKVSQNTQPALVGGSWQLGWTITQKTAAEITETDTAKGNEVRADRNTRLTACDWTQLADSPVTDKAAWIAYRRALRDVPSQAGFPWNVTWPTQPA